MSRKGSLRADSNDRAKVCTRCGGWPAPVRPTKKISLCEACNQRPATTKKDK